MTHDSPRARDAAALPAALAAAAQLTLTSAHHLYGAWRFDTPWRAHVAHIALWLALVLGACLLTVVRSRTLAVRRAAGTAFTIVAVLACGLWLGLFEGGYNHGLKSVFGLAGITGPAFDRFFPPSIYEPPGDLTFEMSGVLQLPVGLLAGHYARRLHAAVRENL